MESKEPYVADRAYGRPEHETLGALGPNCGISDITAISRGSQLCNANSLDTISTGMAISFAMECFENGLLTTKDIGGIDLRFGKGAERFSMEVKGLGIPMHEPRLKHALGVWLYG